MRAVDGISFDVDRGEVFGLLGPNGAGKTTTIEILEGLNSSDTGKVSVLGLDPARDNLKLKERIGVQLQTAALYPNLTVIELIDVFRSFYSHSRPTSELISEFGLEERKTGLTKELSGGQRQRLSVALAMVNDPELIFLDEPTTGLDPQARRSLWDRVSALKNEGRTVVHDDALHGRGGAAVRSRGDHGPRQDPRDAARSASCHQRHFKERDDAIHDALRARRRAPGGLRASRASRTRATRRSCTRRTCRPRSATWSSSAERTGETETGPGRQAAHARGCVPRPDRPGAARLATEEMRRFGRGLLPLTIANVKSYYRDRAALFWTIAFPVIFVILFGSIFSGGPTRSRSAGLTRIIGGIRATAERVRRSNAARTDGRDQGRCAGQDAGRRSRCGHRRARRTRRGDDASRARPAIRSSSSCTRIRASRRPALRSNR